ncbi:MAG: IS200/IS605 family transposase [Candidatus Hydrogenedentes bacterium]|nr:IS200/IS605 family transposase [Candidatus Hydrogenedentota bacterium]
MPQSYCNLLYHMVFSTKHREPLITPDIRERVYSYLGGGIKGEKGIPILINGMEDHVHILAALHQDCSVSTVLRNIKANSSKWIHRDFSGHDNFAWQSGYGAFTVSASQKNSVSKYIENQEEHHKTMTFKEEFIGLLKKHGIEYDERYIWD